MSNIGVQLYTLREQLEDDFLATLQRVAEIGFSAVEFFHYGGLAPQVLRSEMNRLGLKALSSHVPLARLEDELDQVIDEAKVLGLEYIVCPWLPEDKRQTKNDYTALAATLRRVADAAQGAGIRVAYHNHDFEFTKFDDAFALDTLLAETRGAGVQSEIDMYWVYRAGQSPVAYLERYAGRCDLLHVKDVSRVDQSFETVGRGVLPMDDILATAQRAGVKWYIVEQDVCQGNPFDSIQASLHYLQTKLGT